MNKTFFPALVLMVLAVFVMSYYKFYYAKDYDFLVETSCDQVQNNCFTRDCEEGPDCDADKMTYYRQFSIKANDFEKCSNGDCLDFCTENPASCEEVTCVASNGDFCSSN